MINSRDLMYREKVEIIQNSLRSYRQRYAFATASGKSVAQNAFVTTSDSFVAQKTAFLYLNICWYYLVS